MTYTRFKADTISLEDRCRVVLLLQRAWLWHVEHATSCCRVYNQERNTGWSQSTFFTCYLFSFISFSLILPLTLYLNNNFCVFDITSETSEV